MLLVAKERENENQFKNNCDIPEGKNVSFPFSNQYQSKVKHLLHKHFKDRTMAQQLRMLADLAEDPGSVPSKVIRWLTPGNYSSSGSDMFSCLCEQKFSLDVPCLMHVLNNMSQKLTLLGGTCKFVKKAKITMIFILKINQVGQFGPLNII